MFGENKRTFGELQLIIMRALKDRKATPYEIARRTSLHFSVVEHQLILLKGQDYAALVFEHGRFKLFAITEKGKEYLKNKQAIPA